MLSASALRSIANRIALRTNSVQLLPISKCIKSMENRNFIYKQKAHSKPIYGSCGLIYFVLSHMTQFIFVFWMPKPTGNYERKRNTIIRTFVVFFEYNANYFILIILMESQCWILFHDYKQDFSILWKDVMYSNM